MNYQTIDHTKQIAEILPIETLPSVPCSERLKRWAGQLEQQMNGKLQLLCGTEFASSVRRTALRQEHSPLSVAFADPILRAHGLAGETYGHARCFFGIRDRTLHEIVCYCHYSSSVAPGADIAIRVRRAAQRAERIESISAALGLGGTRISEALVRFFV